MNEKFDKPWQLDHGECRRTQIAAKDQFSQMQIFHESQQNLLFFFEEDGHLEHYLQQIE